MLFGIEKFRLVGVLAAMVACAWARGLVADIGSGVRLVVPRYRLAV